jgi:hypothetical protein
MKIKCTQKKCCFHVDNNGENMCPVCNECGATSNIIEENTCVNCWNCLKDEGYVRSGRPDGLKSETEKKIVMEVTK